MRSQNQRADFDIKLTYIIDPVFFFHTTSLDRLWWLWQQADTKRLSEYHRPYPRRSLSGLGKASLQDRLQFSEFSNDVLVAETMSTES